MIGTSSRYSSCDAVVDHGQDGRVAKNGFARAGRSRVALIGGPCVRGEQTPDVRKPLDELKRLFPRDTLALKALLRVFRARKARAAADLLRQLAENRIEVGGKMVAHGLHTHVGHAEVTGEQGYLQARQDFSQHVQRRHGRIVERAVEDPLQRRGGAQLLDHAVKLRHGKR